MAAGRSCFTSDNEFLRPAPPSSVLRLLLPFPSTTEPPDARTHRQVQFEEFAGLVVPPNLRKSYDTLENSLSFTASAYSRVVFRTTLQVGDTGSATTLNEEPPPKPPPPPPAKSFVRLLLVTGGGEKTTTTPAARVVAAAAVVMILPSSRRRRLLPGTSEWGSGVAVVRRGLWRHNNAVASSAQPPTNGSPAASDYEEKKASGPAPPLPKATPLQDFENYLWGRQ